MYMFNTDSIQSLRERRRRRLAALLSQSAYTEKSSPLLTEEQTPLSSIDGGEGTDMLIYRKEWL
jgi:hypothetical protein